MGWLPTKWTIKVRQFEPDATGNVITEGQLEGALSGTLPRSPIGTIIGPLVATDRDGLAHDVPVAVVTEVRTWKDGKRTKGLAVALTKGPFTTPGREST